MKLTNGAAWHTYAGGTSAASDRYGYDAYATIGRYMIQPVSSRHNVERHLGYSVTFLNEKGKLGGGLYQTIKDVATLPEARRLCQEHMIANKGKIVPEQIPGSAA